MSTITDVALESGVSIATVSTVLNNAPRAVRPETRQRVLEAASRLNYHPNAMASGLVRRRMDTIGVLSGVFAATEAITDIYAAGVLQGVLRAAADADFHVTLFTKFWKDGAHSANAYRDRRTDGIVVIAPGIGSDMVPILSSFGILLVTISATRTQGIPSVDVDNAVGARLAVEHLAGLGHTRIAHITGNLNQLSVHERKGAFIAALEEFGCALPDEYIETSRYDARGAEESTRRLLSLPTPPTAIFTGNDAIAMRVIATATEMGIRVPHDLSVVGFDDAPHSAVVTPALTTIRQPLKEIGELASKLLIDRINGEEVSSDRRQIAPILVVRGTSAHAPDRTV